MQLIPKIFLLLVLTFQISALWAQQPSDCPTAITAPNSHPAFNVLTKDYFDATPAWSKLTLGEKKLLVDVSLEQLRRNTALHREFVDTKPKKIKRIHIGNSDVELSSESAEALSQLFEAISKAAESENITERVMVSNGYRSFDTQKENWGHNLFKYFLKTKDNELAGMHDADGNYSIQAICFLRQYSATRYALPGFSTHQSGQALDFNFGVLKADTDKSVVKSWCKSWLFRWLKVHAAEFNFRQNPQIDEPWHWVFDPLASGKAAKQLSFARSCQND
jgi:LAS superfamily LD-carboxypeptidase LdcB